MAKFLVIAGNLREVKMWARHNNVKKTDYKYASSPENILGVANMQVIWTGRPNTHKFYAEIKRMVDVCLASGDLVLAQGNMARG